jgi:mannose-6-phosphate isomerase-like protein (cupin superfamily)
MDCQLTTFGRLREWRIFSRRGDPPNPDEGEVCYHLTCYGRAVVIPGITTEPEMHRDDVETMCVAGGEGVIHLGSQDHAIREGSSLFIPSGQAHHFTNPGPADLEFIFCRRPPASSDGGFAHHHWTEARPQSQWGSPYQGHWHHTYRGPSSGLHIADLPPRKFSQPHSHPPGLDEIWYVHRGNAWHWMGREFRSQGPGSALWLEPTEVHALMNPGDTTVEYMYVNSAALLHERRQRQNGEGAVPVDLVGMAEELAHCFGQLADAYRATDIDIHGVSVNIARVQELIATVKAQVESMET